MARQFIYHMQGLTKAYTGGKKVLEDVHLSFYPDAKIGVLGPNGSGKSTLLRLMAGIDKEFSGEAWLAEGATCGYLPQEPQLDETKTVKENIEEAVREMKDTLEKFNEVSMKMGEPMSDDEMNALLEEQGKLQDIIEAGGGWELDHMLEGACEFLLEEGLAVEGDEVVFVAGVPAGQTRTTNLIKLHRIGDDFQMN